MGILDRAVEKYGERQLDQAQEEIADVNIMIKQVMMLLDIEEFEVQNIEIAKLNRLEKGWIVNEQR